MTPHVSIGENDAEHRGLWMEDGNIILAAASQKDGRAVMFRVHKSHLGRQSTVFANMLLVASAVQVYVDGTPIVSMPDFAEEVEILIGALYDPQ